MGLPLIPTMLSNVLRMTTPLLLTRMDEVRAELPKPSSDNNGMLSLSDIESDTIEDLKRPDGTH